MISSPFEKLFKGGKREENEGKRRNKDKKRDEETSCGGLILSSVLLGSFSNIVCKKLTD